MRRKLHPTHSHKTLRLVLLLLFFGLVLVLASGLYSCAFHPYVYSRGALVFLPGN